MTVQISVAVNNHAGNKTGYLKALEVSLDGDILLRATSSDWGPYFKIQNGTFSLSGQMHNDKVTVCYLSHFEHVGNILWDMFKVEVIEAINLINYLLGEEWDRWEVHEGAPVFLHKWECRKAFEKTDFGSPWEKVKTHKEWKEALRRWTEQKPTPAAGGWKGNE